MYFLCYGAIPVVRATGGLEDTIQDISSEAGTGIKFGPFSASALASAMHRALDLYGDPERLREVRLRGMKADFSWTASAEQYEDLYRSLRRTSET